MKKNKFSVSIVIPNFNGLSLLKKNLPIIAQESEFKRNNVREIILVDDGSSDGSVKFVKENFPQIKLIKHTKNRGFPAAVNTGVRMARGSLVALINNDVVPQKYFLVNVFKHFEDRSVFAVGLHEKGYGWAGGRFENGFLKHFSGDEGKDSHLSLWVSGGSGVFRRKYWLELKGMDQELYSPFYWEDVDIGYRAWKRGLKLLWEPKARVIHKHEQTMSKINPKFLSLVRERNELLFIWKNITSKNLFSKHTTALLAKTFRHPRYLKVIYFALKKYKVVRKKRKIERKLEVVSDESVLAKF